MAPTFPFPNGRYRAALSFTMLHHAPSAAEQDRLLAELARVLRPGGVLAGVDSLETPELRELHVGDMYVPIDPEGPPDRLSTAGLTDVRVEVNPYGLRSWVTASSAPLPSAHQRTASSGSLRSSQSR